MKAGKKTKKAQLQIQEMAFVLVGIILFFGLLLIVFSVFQSAKIKQSAEEIRREETIGKLESIANMPEFSCREAFCIDEEKLIGFIDLPQQDKNKYYSLWQKSKIALIKVERVYPASSGDCTNASYPNCKTYTIYKRDVDYEAHSTFMPLCYYSTSQPQGYKCDITKIIVGFETVA